MLPYVLSILPSVLYGITQRTRGGYRHIAAGAIAALIVGGLFTLSNLVSIVNVQWTWIWPVLRVLMEEGSKITALRIVDSRQFHYVPAIGVGLAFSTVEHILYVSFFPHAIMLRLLLTTPLHCLTLLCFVFLQHRLSSIPQARVFISFAAASVLHAGFNELLKLI